MKINIKYLYRSAGLGDVLWTEPLVKALAGSSRKVVLFTSFNELFNNYPLPNVQVRKIPPGWYRAVLKIINYFSGHRLYYKLDGVYEGMPKMHMLHAYQRYFSLPQKNEYPVIYLSEREKEPIPGLPARYVVLHLDPRGSYNYRMVFGVDWNEVVDYLRLKNISVVITGNHAGPPGAAQVFNGSIRELVRLIYHSEFFIGVDSGPSHIAASLGKPALIFFGSVNPAFRHFPELFKGYFLQQPCEYAGCYHEVIGGRGQTCKLVGDEGIPKCCLHTTQNVKNHIDLLIEKFRIGKE